ncbi:MAG: trypsin-like peptidase domain-containing protein [Akkermansiaceae bacterium]|nr:trypsin-like peptidase domain-containing protein [Akkermansiaceae bacterium]
MKLTKMIKTIAVAGLSLSATVAAHADNKEAARKVFADNVPSVLGVRGLLKIEASMNGQPAGSQEKQLTTNGVVVADGLVAVAYRTIKPDLSANIASRPGLKLESDLAEIKVLDSSGEEYDAKLVLHDEDLGLAFVAIDPKGDKAKDFKVKAVDVSKDVEVKHLDELVGIGRLPENMRSEGRVSLGSVAAIVTRPRTLYIVQGVAMSNPIFTQAGEFIGLTVALKDSGGAPVLIPAKYLRKVLDQAKAKQAELANAPAKEEPKEDKPAEPNEPKAE